MKFCFVFGLEPWLLPPAVEMMEALISKGNTVSVFYSEYQGKKPKEGDLSVPVTSCLPKGKVVSRLFTSYRLARVIKTYIKNNQVDVVIACDILALQSVMHTNIHKKVKTGYWGFEIVSVPDRFRLSLDYFRAIMLPSWVEKISFYIAPSKSRIQQIEDKLKKKIPNEVIYNCKKNKPASIVVKHNVAQINNFKTKLIYTGRVSPTQYPQEIIESLTLLPESVGLFIAGLVSEEYHQHLKNIIDKEGLQNRVYFLGRVSREETYNLINACDIGFAFYNAQNGISAADPAPNKIGDYIAGNLWTIGSNQEYIYFWLEEKGLGICLDNINKSTIATAVNRIISDEKFRNKKRIEEIYHSELNMEFQAGKLLTLIKSV